MTYTEFYQDYKQLSEYNPSYRLGQHFINLFIEDDSDPLLEGLWQADYKSATMMISDIINTYQWDYNNMPLLKEGSSR